LGFKAKSKPSTEFTAKLSDPIIPVDGASLTLKMAAAASSDQTIGATFGYANQLVNLNLGLSYPLTHPLLDFVKADDLGKQKTKIDVDFVAKPLEGHDIYVGGNASISLAKGDDPLLYTSKLSVGLNNKTTNASFSVEHEKKMKKVDDKNVQVHENKFIVQCITEVEDLSGGAQFSYAPADANTKYKGASVEVVAGIQRDNDSKLSSKVQIVPDTTVSLGYEQKLNKSTKISFGYAFLLAKTTPETKTKASAFSFGLELSH